MERYMYKDESFEGMLKEKADEYKMYPSQQSWENIQKRIRHQNRIVNFKSIGLSALLLIGISISLSDDQTTNKQTDFTSFIAAAPDQSPVASTTSANSPVQKTRAKIIPITAAIPAIEESEQPVVFNTTAVAEETVSKTNTQATSEIASKEVSPSALPEKAIVSTNPTEQSLEKATVQIESSSIKPDVAIKAPGEVEPLVAAETIATAEAVSETMLTDAELNYEVNVPMISSRKDKKLLQFHITPSASYRVLYSDNKFTFGNFPQQNPENVVTHRPSVGLEAGASVLFPVSKNVKFRTGLQLNYTRHNVEVFRTAPQLATVVLNYSSTIQRVSSLNTDGNSYLMTEVANETFQVSIPVGLELKLTGRQKLQWHMAANVQPTYLIAASGYLLTNDLKKYIKAPDLLSNLNLNTGIETFLRWNVKNVQFQAGPQLRYQLFSNTRGDYPIKEHLVDYGFRFGVVKTLR
jgi:hypothetical protein